MARRALLLVVVAGAAGLFLVGCSSAKESAETERTAPQEDGDQGRSPLHFAAASPWHTVEAELADGTPTAWIANLPFSRKDAGNEFPEATVSALPPGGIVMVAVGPRPYAGDTTLDALELPLQLDDGRVLARAYEGQPAAHVSYFFAERRVGENLLNVSGYIGNSPPGDGAVTEANEMLATLRVPGSQE